MNVQLRVVGRNLTYMFKLKMKMIDTCLYGNLKVNCYMHTYPTRNMYDFYVITSNIQKHLKSTLPKG